MADYFYQPGGAPAGLDDFPAYNHEIEDALDQNAAVNIPFSPASSTRDIFANAKFHDFDMSPGLSGAMNQHSMGFGPDTGEYAIPPPDLDSNFFSGLLPSPTFEDGSTNSNTMHNSASPNTNTNNASPSSNPTTSPSRSRKRTSSTTTPPNTTSAPKKRKHDADSLDTASLSENFEDGPGVSAEEDKRRRNTAASARFRAKKKEKERAVEERNKILEEQVAALQERCRECEKENRLLKGLLVQKDGAAAALKTEL